MAGKSKGIQGDGAFNLGPEQQPVVSMRTFVKNWQDIQSTVKWRRKTQSPEVLAPMATHRSCITITQEWTVNLSTLLTATVPAHIFILEETRTLTATHSANNLLTSSGLKKRPSQIQNAIIPSSVLSQSLILHPGIGQYISVRNDVRLRRSVLWAAMAGVTERQPVAHGASSRFQASVVISPSSQSRRCHGMYTISQVPISILVGVY